MRVKIFFMRNLFPNLSKGDTFQRFLLIALSILIALILPILMVFSTRSSAALLAITAFILFILEYRHNFKSISLQPAGGWQHFFLGDYPFLALWLGFSLLAFISIFQTDMPLFHTRRLIEFLIPIFTGYFFISILTRKLLPVSTLLLAAGIGIAALLCLLEIQFGGVLRNKIGLKAESFRLNRTMVTLLLLFFPFIALAIAEKRIWLTLLFVPIVGLTVILSDSGAALFGVLVGLCAYAVARLSLSMTAWIFKFASLLIWLLAPWHGVILSSLIPHWAHERLASTSSAIRVEIYRAFGQVVEASPWFGAGFNTAAFPDKEATYQHVEQALQHYLSYGHPHNAALQLWVELGFVGVAFAIALTWGALRLIARIPQNMRPLWYAFFATCLAISVVSHGAWQAWWAANIAICLGLMTMALRVSKRAS